MKPPKYSNLPARFWNKVEVNEATGCWEWQAFTNKLGYGGFRYNGRWQLAHRVSYEAITGLIPKGMELDHLCRIPSCVNTIHLEAVTHRENILRGKTRRHDYMPATVVSPARTHFLMTRNCSSAIWTHLRGRMIRTPDTLESVH